MEHNTLEEKNVLLLEGISKRAEDRFKQKGFKAHSISGALSDSELLEETKNIDILGVRSKTRISREILANNDRLMTIGAFCIGTDQIDIEMCSKKGIAVFNAPYSNTRSVVELALGEIIMLMRGIFTKSQKMHEGTWDKSSVGSQEIRGKKLGIVGYGNIGSQLSVLAESLGLDVCYYDVADKLSLGNATQCKTLDELLSKSDIVSIHIDGRNENNDIIGEEEFKKMKDGVIFLNLSRGFVVNLKSLVKYIKNEKIRGAGIDVYPEEPKKGQAEFISELQKLPNVILTPHIGGSTEEAQESIGGYMSDKLMAYFENGDSLLSVNFPSVQMPRSPRSHRFISIHENIPGMLAKINAVFADHKINIASQSLKTKDNIGYAITDIGTDYPKSVREDLRKISGTIRLRMLY